MLTHWLKKYFNQENYKIPAERKRIKREKLKESRESMNSLRCRMQKGAAKEEK